MILISETFLKPDIKLQVPNYVVYRKDRGNTGRGGVVILLKNIISHSLLPEPKTTTLEVIGVEITEQDGSKLRLFLWYVKHSDDITHTDLDHIFSNTIPTIAAGDFNPKSPR